MATEIKSVEFKILSVDGGGIKGLFSACVLCEIEKANGRLTDYFDMICGTSTGGLIALGLAAGKSVAEIVEFYKELGPSVFPEASLLERSRRDAGFFFGKGKYSDGNLKKAITSIWAICACAMPTLTSAFLPLI
ncbi:MAG: patatin-like phospholipase family protein [Anaerolineae bacterium]|nr:patatin-like phospholipase family protein [Anaerolineae bacterium]